MREILDSHPGLAPVVARAPEYRLQAVLGTIEPGPDGLPRLVQHGFRAGAEYFYPASTVKLFAAVAALEHLGEIARETGLDIDPDTPLVFHPLDESDEREESDPSNLAGGTITVRHEIRKLFLVSDNAAFNRLYELVGQDGLAESMRRAGLTEARIVHRLSELRSAEENRHYPRIDLAGNGFLHTLPERSSEPLAPPPPMPGLEVGSAYLADDQRIEGPMDFSAKNRISLLELQRGLCKLARPDVDCGPGEPYALGGGDRALLLEAMSLLPRESTNPVYDAAEYPDGYVKFLLPGLRRALDGRGFTLYDKSGQAYGFTTENAYVVDDAGGKAFFLAATIYTNSDGVLNDDAYDYAGLALPFLADLAEAAVRWLWLRDRPE
jgi:beta-lactamase family protein